MAILPLKIENLSKKFGSHHVLENISFEVNKGEIFGLIGLNGAGKTTMIKIILGLLTPDQGSASIFNSNSSDKNSRRNLSFLPEKFQPSHLLKGKEFLSLNCSYYKKPFDYKRAKQLAEILRLDPKVLEKRVSGYSKGMGQKRIGRAHV